MTLSGALSNALSGLNAVTRAAGVVSSNVANAQTDGYGRREIELSSRSSGKTGGVQVDSVSRIVNKALLADRRSADASLARSQSQADFMSSVLYQIGEPGSGYSLTDQIAALESALVSAAARPESDAALSRVADALGAVTRQLSGISTEIQQQRTAAEQGIASTVKSLNSLLGQVEKINGDILRQSSSGTSPNALFDERQRIIDQISEIVPVREIDRGRGVVALMTEGGMLIDGPAPTLSFSSTGLITPYHSLSDGNLSAVSVNGQAIDMSRSPGVLSGGKLEGLFAIRDELAPAVQADLDAVARDLVERFEAPGVDPTLAADSAGLLTDDGARFIASDEKGLAGRLQINALIDPAAGGDLWRLRDGIGAAAPGDTGQAAGLNRLSTALTAMRPAASGRSTSSAHSASGLSGDFMSGIGVALDVMQGDTAYATARSAVFSERVLAEGVDTDQEMQNLLLIEQAYAANARVIETVESMLDSLLRI